MAPDTPRESFSPTAGNLSSHLWPAMYYSPTTFSDNPANSVSSDQDHNLRSKLLFASENLDINWAGALFVPRLHCSQLLNLTIQLFCSQRVWVSARQQEQDEEHRDEPGHGAGQHTQVRGSHQGHHASTSGPLRSARR